MTPEDQDKSGSQDGDDSNRPKHTGQYLRKARQKARKLGLNARDDAHAAQLLEGMGIDVLNDDVSLLSGAGQNEALAASGPAVSGGTMTLNDAERLSEVYTIQRDLVRRRRRRLVLLLLRLLFFVALPTFLVGRYYYVTATNMYETETEFAIQKSEASGAGGLGSLFSGTGFANSTDSISVQGYLTSREAMNRLDAEFGFRNHFQQDFIDDIQRLDKDAGLEEAYKLYEKNVKVGFDPTEGIIRLQVIAATAAASEIFASALIIYAEERVDELSQRVREDQMRGAAASYENAERSMVEAQNQVLALQQERGVFSAEAEISSQMSIINALELQIESRQLSLSEILDNPNPSVVRADVLRREIERLKMRVTELRDELTESTEDNISLATISGELKVAEANMVTRQLMLQQALQQMELARIEANRQVRYLSVGVSPVAPDTPTYPRKLENTMLAFVIFMGIYIMLSLTVAILREQVSV